MGAELEQRGEEQEGAVDVGSLPDGATVAAETQELAPSSPPLIPSGPSMLPAGDAAFNKRQRRPNVRLNEIGSESSLANVVEYLLKRKGGHSHGHGRGRRGPSIVAAKRGRKPQTEKDSPSAVPTRAPGKLSKMPKIPANVKNDDNQKDDDDDDDDDDLLHDTEESQPRASKPFEEDRLTPTGRKRKVRGLGTTHFPDHKMMPATISKRVVDRPKPILLHPPEGSGNVWMHKAMAGVADGFLEAADGGVYGCSDTDKHLPRSPSPRTQQPVHSSYESDSPKGFRKAQAPLSPKGFHKAQAPSKKPKKKVGSSGPKSPTVRGYARRGDAVEEKEEPGSSDVQELRSQGPVWEMGVPPLDEKVREWIRGIGLEKYASVFQHHEVGDDVVPLLTMDDLKEMGINAVGARRKFFGEITKRKQALMLTEEPPTPDVK